jgi:ferritin-like metal-binding protein YciE
MKEIKDNDTRDAAMIAAAQAIEHYEIARYGALVSWAGLLNMPEARNLLRDTLAEEKDTDSKLNRLAEDKLNQKAA